MLFWRHRPLSAVFDAATLTARASLSLKPDRFFADASARSAPGHCPKAVELMTSGKTPGRKKCLPFSSRVHVGKRARAVDVPWPSQAGRQTVIATRRTSHIPRQATPLVRRPESVKGPHKPRHVPQPNPFPHTSPEPHTRPPHAQHAHTHVPQHNHTHTHSMSAGADSPAKQANTHTTTTLAEAVKDRCSHLGIDFHVEDLVFCPTVGAFT